MPLRALVIWLALIPVAIANAGLRNALLTPRVGERAEHVAGAVLLSLGILLVIQCGSWYRRPRSRRR